MTFDSKTHLCVVCTPDRPPPLAKRALVKVALPPSKRAGQYDLREFNVGAIIIRIEYGGMLYKNYNKEPPNTQNPILIIKAPKLRVEALL